MVPNSLPNVPMIDYSMFYPHLRAKATGLPNCVPHVNDQLLRAYTFGDRLPPKSR